MSGLRALKFELKCNRTFLMEDLAGKLSVEKGSLYTLYYVSMTIFLLTQEILGLYCFYFVIQYHCGVIKPFVFMFCQPWCACMKGYSHKRTESSFSLRKPINMCLMMGSPLCTHAFK